MPDADPRPLDALRVLDLTSEIAGPYATKLLRDAGASVVKVERPDGDPLRRWTASQQTLGPGEDGPLFQFLAAGKRSIVLDPRDARDRARFRAFAERADVVVEDWGPGGLEAMGLSPEDWLEVQPRLAIVRISPWGQTGPWAERPANDFTLQAAAGSIEYRGLRDRDPMAAGGRIGEWVAGSYAALAALATWRSCRQTGEGQVVDLSIFESILLCCTTYGDLSGQFNEGPLPRSIDVPSIEPSKDGWVGFCTQTGQQWVDFCSMLGRQDVAENPRYMNMRNRMDDLDFISGMIHEWTRERTTEEIIQVCELLRIPAAPIGNGRDLPGFDHLAARGVYQRAPGGFLQPRAPWRLETAEPTGPAPAPALDADREALLESIEAAAPTPPPLQGDGDLPFSGLRVVDFTAFWAGPYSTSILSDLGADVIKIESIQRPDGMRFAGGLGDGSIWEKSFVYHGANPGKRDVTLKLDDEKGLALAKRLIADADVVIENFSVQVIERFGLDAETIRALNPRAIFVRMPAFGLDGPWRDRAGFAMTVEQVSGLAWVTGYEDLPLVMRGVCDPCGGVHAIFALGLALEERRRTGRGQLLEVALLEPALNLAAEQVIEYSAHGVLLERHGNRMPHAAPQGVFPSRDPEQLVALSVTREEHWRALCRLLDAEEWRHSEALSSHHGRLEQHDVLCDRVAAWVAEHSSEEAVEALLAEGIPASPVQNAHHLMPNDQLIDRRFFQTMKHPVVGEIRYPGLPFRFALFERELHRLPPPTLGQHNREVLQGELGLDDADLEALEREGVIGTRPSFM